MKANPDKCHLFKGTKTIESVNNGEHKIRLKYDKAAILRNCLG